MAGKSKIRMERSAMRDRIRTQRALERGRLSGHRRSTRQPAPTTNKPGAQMPARTTPPVEMVPPNDIPETTIAYRREVMAKITELQAKLQLFLAVNTFTLQKGRNTAEVRGTEFEGQHHIFRFVHTHPIDTVAKHLTAVVPKVEIDNWVSVMTVAISNCPIAAPADWECDIAVGIFNLKSALIALLAKLETCTTY